MRSRSTLFLATIASGASLTGCTLLAGLTEDYRLVEGHGGMGGSTTSSSSTGGGGASSSSSSSSSSSHGGGGASSSSSSSSTTTSSTSSSSSSSGTGGTGGSSSSSSSSSGSVTCQPNSTESCYTGPLGTKDVGVCKGGTRTCNAQGDGYGPCQGEVTPTAEKCNTPVDDDCDGTALDEDAGCVCLPGSTSSCYSGPGGTENIGICKPGTTTCNADGKGYGLCMGEVLPQTEDCMTPDDDDCDGVAPPCLGGEIWAKRFGDATSQVTKGVAVQPDGTSYWIGAMNGMVDFGAGPLVSSGGTDVFLAKLGAAGGTIWAKRYGDASNQEGRSVAVDSTGAVAITGAFNGTIDLGGGLLTTAGSNDVFLAKLDSNGNQVFAKNFGNNSNQYGNSVAFAPTGDIVLAGYLGGAIDFGGGLLTSAGSSDVFIAKFSGTGVHMWSKIAGNSLAQVATSMAVDQMTGDIALTGHFAGQIDFGSTSTLTTAGLNDIFLVKYDSAGSDIWAKRFGDGGEQFANAVAIDPSGNIALTGQFAGTVDFGCGPLTSAGGYDAFVAVFGPTGTCFWSSRFGDAADQNGLGVAFDADGNVLLTGSFAGSVNLSGQVLTSAGGVDVFVAKFDSMGAGVWSKRVGDTADQTGLCVGTDAAKNVFVGGGFAGIVNFGVSNLMSAGADDIFFAKLFP